MPSIEWLWLLPILAVALLGGFYTAFQAGRWGEERRLVIDEVIRAGAEVNNRIHILLETMSHIYNRTSFGVKVESYLDTIWRPWRRRYQAVLLIYLSEEEDRKKIEPIATHVVHEYRLEPTNPTYRMVIDFRRKDKGKNGRP